MEGGKAVLILTESDDGHSDLVQAELAKRGARVARFHTADFPLAATLNISASQSSVTGKLCLPNAELPFEEIAAVWYRRPQPSNLPEWPEAVTRFAAAESGATLESVWQLLDCYWMSPPNRIREARNRLPQLRLAVDLGFSVPETLVTNDPEAARQFCAVHHDGVVYKTIASGFVEYLPTVTGTIYTTLLEQKHLAELDRVEVVPCLFQEYVAKAVELRVTVVGTEVFAAQIDSQATERTKHDWRRYDSATPYSQHRLPQDEEERCVTLVRSLGLEFGAIDLVLRPDGRYVFLEINANGQWGWIEQLTGFPIAAAIADRLIEKGDCLGRVMTA